MMISNWEEEDQGFLIEFHNLVLEPEEGRKMDLLKLQEEQVHSIIKRLIRKNEKVFRRRLNFHHRGELTIRLL